MVYISPANIFNVTHVFHPTGTVFRTVSTEGSIRGKFSPYLMLYKNVFQTHDKNKILLSKNAVHSTL